VRKINFNGCTFMCNGLGLLIEKVFLGHTRRDEISNAVSRNMNVVGYRAVAVVKIMKSTWLEHVAELSTSCPRFVTWKTVSIVGRLSMIEAMMSSNLKKPW
jgi:hypothetical protein